MIVSFLFSRGVANAQSTQATASNAGSVLISITRQQDVLVLFNQVNVHGKMLSGDLLDLLTYNHGLLINTMGVANVPNPLIVTNPGVIFVPHTGLAIVILRLCAVIQAQPENSEKEDQPQPLHFSLMV
eukprot:10489352-Ditylum_brightwellii.AAC.1